MDKEVIYDIIRIIFLKCIYFGLSVLVAFGVVALIELHLMVPFFPVLFLFDFCFVVVYPLFLRYVLIRKWFECLNDYYLKIKYILLPVMFMEILALFVIIMCYPNEILQAS